MAQFEANVIWKIDIECLTGLHIGGSQEKVEIGGVDSPVVRDPSTNYPYIPGSSLKGKMRSLSEYSTGKVEDGKPHNCADSGCWICRLFGTANKEWKAGPARLIVRDAHPNKDTIEMWDTVQTELLYTELKWENYIDRISSAAAPRQLERVIKASTFESELTYSLYQIDNLQDVNGIPHLIEALRLLEDSALGGSGSRGYGRIRIRISDPLVITREDYQNLKELPSPSEPTKDVKEISPQDVLEKVRKAQEEKKK